MDEVAVILERGLKPLLQVGHGIEVNDEVAVILERGLKPPTPAPSGACGVVDEVAVILERGLKLALATASTHHTQR